MINIVEEGFSWRLTKEVEPLIHLHYKEIGDFPHKIKLDPDFDRYEELDSKGELSVVTVRDDGRLVGYSATIVTFHAHYKSSLIAYNDVIYLLPEYRRGATTLRFFRKVEECVRKRGAVSLYFHFKVEHDHPRLFSKMGFRNTEKVYGKLLEGGN